MKYLHRITSRICRKAPGAPAGANPPRISSDKAMKKPRAGGDAGLRLLRGEERPQSAGGGMEAGSAGSMIIELTNAPTRTWAFR